jgi:hypothetical protein
MFLNDLQENKFAKLSRALNEVFGINFNFSLDAEKLQAIQKSTQARIHELKESGIDASDRNYQKLLLISEGIKMALREVSPPRQDKKVKVQESQDLDQAEVLLAAKQMADDLQKMAEDLASMQVEELMSITNAMKEQVGTAEAEAFNTAAEAAIAGALEAVKSANDQVNNAVLTAQGQPVVTDMDPEEFDIDDDIDDLEIDAEDDFEGADSADAMSDQTGREMKEDAYLSALRMVKEAQQNGKVNKELLKKAFSVLRQR